MRVTEAIAALEEILESDGDLEVISLVCVESGFLVDRDHKFEILGLPLAEGEDESIVVGFVDSHALSEMSAQ